ncbi:MAG: PolC-type DNA polymerase III [Firmicutes bacterium]|nr:PolC-type DNA polymerase III [Bacillota bacterium]
MEKFQSFFQNFFNQPELISNNFSNIIIESIVVDRDLNQLYINLVSEKKILDDEKNFLENKFKEFLKLEVKLNFKIQINGIEIRKGINLLPKIILSSALPIFGEKIEICPMEISKIKDKSNVIFWGDVFDVVVLSNKFGNFCSVRVTDYTGSITLKLNRRECNRSLYDVLSKLEKGKTILVNGIAYYDDFEKEFVVLPKILNSVDKIKTVDNSYEKRIELHLHTSMSAMDGISPIKKILDRAIEFGHNAVAITDHGVVQAFPDAMNLVNKIKEKNKKFKIIYGIENYFIDDLEISEKDNNKLADVLTRTDIKKKNSYHQTILVKNNKGLKNLYKLVSISHLNYFYKKPRIPKSEIIKFRDGLIIGSACESGQLFRSLVLGLPTEDLLNIAKFYDYLEIQPIDNNRFLIREGYSTDEEQLKNFNKKIVDIGEKLNIPVVATGDVHFLNPEDSEYRKLLMLAQGYKDGAIQAPLYFKTTAEMLEDFSYLGKDKALEVVVENPNKISDMIDSDILPIPKGMYPPHMDGAEEELVSITRENTKKVYGDPLPKIVSDRLEKELNSITRHGYSVLYMVAQKLVSKSEKDGFLVGSRGSVGSSFVATMAGISEVNPLVPHYICKNCKYSEFVTDGSYGSGFDLPEKKCQKCDLIYHRDGNDIPFETFLGFDGNKTPDIDLNFSGEYQIYAHKFTEEIFGKNNVFKAGTIGTIAERSGMGFVKKAIEDHGLEIGKTEQRRLALGCTGVKRTTGQHPGGMVIVPKDMEIYDFCPVQRPANDQSSDNITTHFDFHSIHDTICKLDELGHDVPTIYKYLEEYTGIPIIETNISDPLVLSLFTSTKALGIKASDIGSRTGTFSLPEVGTFFVRQMLEEAKPKSFADLVQISGLSHGTDVWNGNARNLIKNGVCTISEVVGTRDSVMTYLTSKGMDKKEAFNIMEIVRKGKASSHFTKDIVDMIKSYGVPDWYIESCKKIKYMFPKAHAVAYMISAFRLGWYKVHRPLEYYAAYFTVRNEDIDNNLVLAGRNAIRSKIKEISDKGKQASLREISSIQSLQILNEAMARNIKFMTVDLYKSDVKKFKIEDGKIRLPFTTVAGLGETAAEGIVKSRDLGKFISILDLKEKTKITKSVIELMRESGVLEGMQESNQMSMF